MKKITFNAPLNHKAYSYEPMQIEVEKVITLYLVEGSEGFLRTEYHVSVRNVVVTEQNESYATVQDSGLTSEDKIVSYSNKELYKGQIVRMG